MAMACTNATKRRSNDDVARWIHTRASRTWTVLRRGKVRHEVVVGYGAIRDDLLVASVGHTVVGPLATSRAWWVNVR